MDTDLIKEIATTIVNETLLENWLFYALFLIIGFLGASGVAYFKPFAAEKAKNNVIQSDLEKIKNQLKETTRVTEEIKNDLEHEVWRKKEIESIRRNKLEEYFSIAFSCKKNLASYMKSSLYNLEENYDEFFLDKLEVLQNLYFPELNKQHALFIQLCYEYMEWVIGIQKERVQLMNNGVPLPPPTTEQLSLQDPIINKLKPALEDLTKEGIKISKTLNC